MNVISSVSLLLPILVLGCAGSVVLNNDISQMVAHQAEGRDYHYYPSADDDKSKEYQYQTYPPLHYAVKDGAPGTECPPNPMMPFLNGALNFLLIKLGIVGIIKAIAAALFFGFLFKLPLILVKLAFLKAFFLPVVLAPILLLFAHGQGMMMPPPTPPDDMAAATEAPGGMGRDLEGMSEAAWRSARMLAGADRCLELLACSLGSYSNDTVLSSSVRRMTRYVEYATPPATRDRIRALRDAFQQGGYTGNCVSSDFPCQSPQIVLRHGDTMVSLI